MSKARLAEYEADVERLEKQYQELHYMTERLKAARDFESLKEEKEYYVNLSGAEKELGKVNKKKPHLRRQSALCRKGSIRNYSRKSRA